MKKSKPQAISLSVGAEYQHFNRCDSSGALAIDNHHFVVADDEQNIISVYRSQSSGPAIKTFFINSYFDPIVDEEADIEGSTVLAGLMFWITSHGRNRRGEDRPQRRQFFANRLITTADSPSDPGELQQVGHSYTQLLTDLIADPRWQKYDFAQAAQIPPKQAGGFNIESLAATPQQKLLIGLRNPIVAGKAIVIKLKNPRELVLEPGSRAQFGKPIELDLGGLGLRSMEYWPQLQQYLIVAGAYDSSDRFAIYLWSGKRSAAPQLLDMPLPADFRPEGIVIYPDQPAQVQLISDDGKIRRAGQTACQDLPTSDRYFRSLWLTLNR